MDRVQLHARDRMRKPLLEGLEDRRLPATIAPLPNVAVLAASTTDSKSVTINYEIDGAPVAQPLTFAVYRSAATTVHDGDPLVGTVTVAPTSPGLTLDQSGTPATAQGRHTLQVAIPTGLSIDPSHPNVVVVADPNHNLAQTNRADDTASFHKYAIGVISHGGLQPLKWKDGGPPWERRMAAGLLADGYDAVIPFNWVAASSKAGSAEIQSLRLTNSVTSTAAQFPAGSPVDVHYIGHSEGAVVNSEAIRRIDAAGSTPALRSGWQKVTMLDPHAANNQVIGKQYSIGSGLIGGPIGWVARQEINGYQSRAKDPLPFVSASTDEAEVYFQHTPVSVAQTNSGIYNLWGQVPVKGTATYYDLTAPGISHAGKYGVQDWYRLNVVPTLATGGQQIRAAAVTGAPVQTAATASGIRVAETFVGHASPGVTIRLFGSKAGQKKPTLQLIGHTSADASGSWKLKTIPLAGATYRLYLDSSSPRVRGPHGRPIYVHPTAFLGTQTLTPPTPTT